MALIKCPECDNSISDSAKSCPHCGFNLDLIKNTVECPYCNFGLPNKIKMNYSKKDNEYICPQCNRTVGIATPEQEVIWAAQKHEENNIPKCPTCSSTNITRISATSRVINAGMFGLLGNKRKKTFHCNNCKYEW
ncbi:MULTISPECIES: zinc ribbon domain-containing protein [unclassified Lacrimispora]|uniref:zinc ribbon domain-containing protein n=1 Tax=unclassified Lacrimispora TaxID=2719232 RepID=UPI00376FF4F0